MLVVLGVVPAVAALWASLGIYESTLSPLTAPTAVRGDVRGIDSVGVDPAGVAAVDGWAVEYRHRLVREEDGFGRLGAFAAMPLSRVVLYGGYEWLQVPRARFERGTVGVAGIIDERLWVGLMVHNLSSKHPDLNGQVWSFGLTSELTSWLTLSAGIDGFNRPHLLGADIRPDYVFGASVRPIVGEPWLSLGSEVRIGAGAHRGYDFRLSRAVLDASPYQGVHVQAAYERLVDDLPPGSRLRPSDGHQLWVGLSVALGGLEARAVTLGFREDMGPEDAFADTYLSLSMQAHAAESILEPWGRTVEVPLSGDLRDAGGILSAGSPLASVAWRLDRLAEDASVDTVLVPIGQLDVGLATIDELRAAIARLRAAGKQVIAYIYTADDKAYMVAAACNAVRMDPVSVLVIDGFAVSTRYFADALDKIGIRFQSVEIGRYKSAPDTLTRSTPRPEEAEVRQAIVDQAYESLMTALTHDRGLSREEAEKVVQRGVLTAADALELRLVDELSAPTDATLVPNIIPGGEPLVNDATPSRRWSQRPAVAVIPIVGTLAMRASDNPLPGPTAEAGDIITAIDDAAGDGDVAAVVLRIDSPGGDILASDLVWRSVRRLAEVKPVVVSMGDLAASGGYYVAMPAHHVFAESNTVTGSIGVFALRADVSGLFDKLGIHTETYKRGEHADEELWTHTITEDDRERVGRSLRAFYETFLGKVAAGRKLPIERVRALAEGRIYTGTQAQGLGLVDSIGTLADAIREAQKRAGLGEHATPNVEVRWPEHRRTFTRIVKNLIGLAAAPEPSVASLWDDLQRRAHLWDGRVLALLPVSYEIDR